MGRQFADILGDLEGGQVVADLTTELNDLTSQVMALRKAGVLDLKIHVLPNGENSVEVRCVITSKAPEPARERTIMFADEHGGLRRENPRQMKLGLREVAPAQRRELPETQEARTS